jgi:Uma2 family endonuclease
MSTQLKPYITPQQYLAIEREAQCRSEYFDGEMFAMSGGTLRHAKISHRLALSLGNQLRGRECDLVSADMRVRVFEGPYFYPDVVVYCGRPQFEDESEDTLTDATLIIEILSPSTERYDRTLKFEYYKRLPSLTDYLLVAQDRIHIEKRSRGGDGIWQTIETTDPAAILDLHSIGCGLRVADVYENVEFA